MANRPFGAKPSRDYGLYLNECQKWKEDIENTKMAKFEAPGIKE